LSVTENDNNINDTASNDDNVELSEENKKDEQQEL